MGCVGVRSDAGRECRLQGETLLGAEKKDRLDFTLSGRGLGSGSLPSRGSVVAVTPIWGGGTYLFGAPDVDLGPDPTYLLRSCSDPRPETANSRARASAHRSGAARIKFIMTDLVQEQAATAPTAAAAPAAGAFPKLHNSMSMADLKVYLREYSSPGSDVKLFAEDCVGDRYGRYICSFRTYLPTRSTV